MRKTSESEDSSISAILYQGKPLSQWEKEFEGEFTAKQLLQLIRSGVDIGRVKLGLVDEADDFNDPVFKDEKFADQVFESRGGSIKDYIMPNIVLDIRTADTDAEVYVFRVDPNELDVLKAYVAKYGTNSFNANNDGFCRQMLPVEKQSIKNPLCCYIVVDGKRLSTDPDELSRQANDVLARVARVNANTIDFKRAQFMKDQAMDEVTDEEAALDESLVNPDPEDVVTVDDLISMLRSHASLDDKLMFRVNKQEHSLFDIHSKGGVTVIDLVKGKYMNESITPEQWKEAADWFNSNGYEVEDDEVRLEQFGPQMDQFLFKAGMSPTGKDEVVSGDRAYEFYKSLKESKMKKTNEGRGWYGGGYGGTGRSWKSLGGRGPRGAEIGWYSVADLDPKAKGKMSGWRCGPSNFPFKDTFFPNRKYKIGTMVMRNKYVNAGPFSGEMYIAIPSYFEIVNSGNEEGINVLNALGIPLDLTFGMDPKDDYSMTYTEKLNEQYYEYRDPKASELRRKNENDPRKRKLVNEIKKYGWTYLGILNMMHTADGWIAFRRDDNVMTAIKDWDRVEERIKDLENGEYQYDNDANEE